MKDFTSELSFKTSRSSGAGGQNVNKVETAVTVLWDISSTKIFNDDEVARIRIKLKNRISSKGVLQISVSESRTQFQNRRIATQRIFDLVEDALYIPKTRLKTKPSKTKMEKRLAAKRKISEKKENRNFRI